MKLQKITLRNVVASCQPRPLVTSEVDKLAASIGQVGLIQPVTVRPTVVIHGTTEPGFRIVAGHHRVAACRALGWTEIDALVIDDTNHLQSELMEIDENLCRAELTASQRTGYTKRRKQIWEALHPEDSNTQRVALLENTGTTSSTITPRGVGRPKEFAASTAEATGMTKQAINRHIARADALGDEALTKVAHTSLDSGVELDALAKMPAPERAVLIERAAAGEQVSARTPDAPVKPSTAPAHTLPMRLYKAVHDMVHSLGFADVKSLIEAIADLPELTNTEQSTLDDALDVFMSIGEMVPAFQKA